MSGPKHLWSGNWERESESAAEQRPPRLPLVEPAQPQAPEEPEPREPRNRRGMIRYAWAGAAFLLVLVVGVALAVTLGGSNKPRRHTSSTPARITTPTTPTANPSGGAALQQRSSAPAGSGPTATWLGMEIVTGPNGAVVNSLKLGSVADQVGFEPGDVIASVDGHQIGTVPELARATAGQTTGSIVRIQVLRGSSFVEIASVPMTDRPTIHR